MKILFISHMRGNWTGFEHIIAEEKPDVLLIGGGVFPNSITEVVNEELREILFGERFKHSWWREEQKRMDYMTKNEDFFYKLSIIRFYSALQYAGLRCKVFTVKARVGDAMHQREQMLLQRQNNANIHPFFMPAYDSVRINAIKNCEEVSGRIVNINGLRLLGLGGLEFGFLKKLRPIVSDAETNPPDVIFASISLEHGKRIPRVEWICTRLKPKLVIYGWYGPTHPWAIDKTRVVESGIFPSFYVTIAMDHNEISEILVQWFYPRKNVKTVSHNVVKKHREDTWDIIEELVEKAKREIKEA